MDKIELQRLLDGELDHEQRRRLLCQLDEQSTQWRTVALAMLEEQEFRREFTTQTNQQSNSPVSQSNSKVHASPMKSDFVSRSSSRWFPMTLAASLLVGLGVAGGNWLASQFDHGSSPSPKIVGPAIAVQETKKAESTNNVPTDFDFASLKPVGQLSFTSDATSNADDSSVQVPIYETAPEQFNQMLLTHQRQMQEWNEQLRRRGYQLDWQPEMIESRLPDGRSVIVPIQQVHVRNLGQ